MLKSLKFCHVKGGKNHFDFHAWLSDITIENLKNAGCTVTFPYTETFIDRGDKYEI